MGKELCPLLISTEAAREWCDDHRIKEFLTLIDLNSKKAKPLSKKAEPLIIFIPRGTDIAETLALRQLALTQVSKFPQVFLMDERAKQGMSSYVCMGLSDQKGIQPICHRIDLVSRAFSAALRLGRELNSLSLKIVCPEEFDWLAEQVRIMFGYVQCVESKDAERRIIVSVSPRERQLPMDHFEDLYREGDLCVLIFETQVENREVLECSPGTAVSLTNFSVELDGLLCKAQESADSVEATADGQ